MSKICPNCQEVFDDSHAFCSNCGSRLVDNVDVNPVLNLGDANAISGGVSINQSKNITSHDTHYHSTTVHERAKSESELKLDATNQLRAKAEEIMAERGRIDSVAMSLLRPLANQLGIDDDTFKSIIKDVRSNRNGSANGLSAANARYLQQAQQAVQTNDMDGLSNLTPRLEAMATISQDDNVQYLYYLTLCLLYPIKSMEVYERQMDENYWRSFWAIISYIRTGKHAEATKVLALFDPLRFEKSEEDQNLLEAYFNIMKEDKDAAQEFLDEILGEPTEQVKPLLRAVESKLYEEEAESLEVRFYMERVMTKSDAVVKSQKKFDAASPSEEPAKKAPKSAETMPEPKQATGATPAPEPQKDNKEAEELYAKACAASGAKHVMLLQKAADAGSLDAMCDLSDCYYDGEGVDKNVALAVKWMSKAADMGSSKAQLQMGGVYYKGADGIDQNYVLAEKYLLQAAKHDIPDAQAMLADLYFTMEEYEKSLVWARKAAQLGHSYACFILGRIYDEGLGVDTNHAEGLKWFEKSADAGDADAQNIVGNIYSNGESVAKDEKKAFRYYQKAAAQGHLWGMYNLSGCYVSGQGTDLDLLKAGEWLRKAAEGGLQEAINTLNENPQFKDNLQVEKDPLTEEEAKSLYDAVDTKSDSNSLLELQKAAESGDVWGMFYYARLYSISNSVESNYELAVQYYTNAANAGNIKAMNNLGLCYEHGNGVKQDCKEAAKWFRKASDAGNEVAMCNLGFLFKNGDGVKQDYSEAVKWYRKAASAENPRAMGELGLCYENGNGVKKNIEEAVKWYKKGADYGDALSMLYLGVCYDNGNGIVQDYSKAFSLFQKAAKDGVADAMNWLGTYYHNGKGVDINYSKAFEWYEKAIEFGDSWAMSNMGLLYENGLGVKIDKAKAREYYEMSANLGNETAMLKIQNWDNKPEAKIVGLWALNANPYDMSGNSYGNDSSFIIHCHIQVDNMNGRTGKAVLTMSVNGVSFNKSESLNPNYDSCTWQDFRFPIYANDIINLVTKGQHQLLAQVDLYDDQNVCMASSSINVNIKYSSGLFSGAKVEIV